MPQANADTKIGTQKTSLPWPVDAVVGFALWAVFLVLFQFFTMSKFSALPPGAGFLLPADFYREARAVVHWQWSDSVLFAALVAGAFFLLYRELRAGSLSRLFALAMASERRAQIFLALNSLLLLRYYGSVGQMPWGGDAAEHIAYSLVASRAFSLGEWPIWTNFFAGGSPYLQFYGFLFFYCVGLVDQVFGDIHTSLKLVMASAHIASALTLYGLARLQRLERPAAFVAALAYILCVWHAQQVLFMGRFPLALFYALLPLPFFFFERARLLHRQIHSIVWGALSLAALAFTHPGYGYWATLFFAIYVAIRSRAWRGLRHRRWFFSGVIIALLGLVFGAYLTLPMYMEREFTGLWNGVSLASVEDPGWQHLLVWSNFRIRLLALPADQYHWYGGYMGLSLVAFACAAAVGWLASRMGRADTAVLPLLFLSLVLVLAYRNPWVQAVPMVTALSSGRYLLFVTFFLALAAGWGGQYLCAGRRQRYGLLLLLLAVDLGTTTFQQPYLARSETPAIYPRELTNELAAPPNADGRLPSYRLYATTKKIPHFVAVSWLFAETGIPTPQFLYTEAPRAQDWLVQPWSRFVSDMIDSSCDAEQLKLHRDYSLLYDGARLQNLRHIVGLCDEDDPEKIRAQLYSWTNNTPILVAPKLAPFPEEELERLRESGELDDMIVAYFPERENVEEMVELFPTLWTIQAMGIHPVEKRCETIYLRSVASERAFAREAELEVISHDVWNERVDLQVRTSGACFARLAYAYYPFLEVRVDGVPVEIWQTAGGFIALELKAGEHRIELLPRLSPWRRFLLALNGILLVLGGVACWYERRRS